MRRTLLFLICGLAISLAAGTDCKGERGSGKYCGVVIFDRWGGCTLYSGIYVMYISEKVKDELRDYAGQAIQIQAEDVYQPKNPGDGLIRKLKYLGQAPETRNWIKTEGITLSSSIKMNDAGKPIATITILNKGKEPIKLFSQELALTLLTKKNKSQQKTIDFSDGPSYALITRQSFEIGSSEPRWEGKGYAAGSQYSWTIGKENALPHDFTLEAGKKKQIDIQFDLPDCEYDFLCGYGGGVHEDKCLASNLSAFDVKDGKAKIIKTKNTSEGYIQKILSRTSYNHLGASLDRNANFPKHDPNDMVKVFEQDKESIVRILAPYLRTYYDEDYPELTISIYAKPQPPKGVDIGFYIRIRATIAPPIGNGTRTLKDDSYLAGVTLDTSTDNISLSFITGNQSRSVPQKELDKALSLAKEIDSRYVQADTSQVRWLPKWYVAEYIVAPKNGQNIAGVYQNIKKETEGHVIVLPFSLFSERTSINRVPVHTVLVDMAANSVIAIHKTIVDMGPRF